jgi:nucleoid-associated protein YgaU
VEEYFWQSREGVVLMAYFQITRYAEDDKILYGNDEIHEIRNPKILPEDNGDEIYVVETSDDLKNIAFKVYGEARYWWIIADHNGIIDPFKALETGTELRCPSLRSIRSELL